MPYQSVRQSNYIHEKASEGVPWAQQFVADAHGTHVLHKKAIKRQLKKKRRHHAR